MVSGITIGLSLLAGVALSHVAFFVVIPVVILLAFLRRQGVWTPVILAALCVLVGIARGAMPSDSPDAGMIDQSIAASGVVASMPTAGGADERALLRLERIAMEDDTWHEASGFVIVYFPEQHDELSLGDRVVITWEATPVDALSPGYASWVRSQGSIGSAWAWTYETESHGPAAFEHLSGARRTISHALEAALPGNAGALASGIVTGDDSAMSSEVEEAFRLTGTGHITSVSGQNVALLIGFLSLWFRPSGGIQRLVLHGSMIVVVWTYALMVGLEPPALRAATVATLTIFGAYTGRRPDPLTLLALTLGAMAMIDPITPRMVGFWLSASASWALCMVVKSEQPSGFRRQVINLASGPLAATIATLPILIATFHEWSPIAPLANAAIGPLVTVMFAVTYLFVPIALLVGPMASAVAWIPGIGLDLIVSTVEWLALTAPQVHLAGMTPGGVMMVALPCLLLIVVFSRDVDRWLRRVAWGSSSGKAP